MVLSVKNPPSMKESQVRSLGQEDPLEKETATHFSILAWRIPWTEEATAHGVVRVGLDLVTKPPPLQAASRHGPLELTPALLC